jgi:hypothetical protein
LQGRQILGAARAFEFFGLKQKARFVPSLMKSRFHLGQNGFAYLTIIAGMGFGQCAQGRQKSGAADWRLFVSVLVRVLVWVFVWVFIHAFVSVSGCHVSFLHRLKGISIARRYTMNGGKTMPWRP